MTSKFLSAVYATFFFKSAVCLILIEFVARIQGRWLHAKMSARRLLELAFAWAYGLSMVVIPFALLAIKSLFKGRQVWFPRPRTEPPKCLKNPEYGTHKYIQLKDIKLHYVEAGNNNKPLVVFLHGFPEFWYSWRHQIKALKSEFWTVAVDMRGYGDSAKPSDKKLYHTDYLVDDVKHLVQALGRKSCFLVAHDWGGLVAFMVANRYPEMIDKLVVMNAPHPAAFGDYMKSSWKQLLKSWYVSFFQVPFLPEFFVTSEDIKIFDQIFRGSHFEESSVTDDDIEAFKYTFSSRDKWTPPINYYRMARFTSKTVQQNRNKSSVPCMIVWGCHDLALERRLAELSSEYFDNCTVNYVEHAGHFVQQDAPSIVNKHLKSFLKI